MYMTKQIKSLYQKMNLIMSCKNMGIENVVSKQKNKQIFIIFNKKLQTNYIIHKKKLIEITM